MSKTTEFIYSNSYNFANRNVILEKFNSIFFNNY